MSVGLLVLLLGGLGAFTCLIAAYWVLRRKRLIDDTPTSKTQGVFIGLTELKGTAESETPLTSYLAGARCVHYSWHIEEQWSRIVTETYRDAQGRTQTRTRRETGWSKVASGGESLPFYLKDDTGVIRIVPEGAHIEDTETFSKTCTPADSMYFGKGPSHEVANSDHRRRFHETALPLHAMLYIMGLARERKDVVAAEIVRDKDAPMFVISTRSERQLSAGYGRWFWFWLVLGALVSVAVIVLTDSLQQTGAVHWPIALATYLVAAALGWVWAVYNSLINLHHQVEKGWSQVDVQLKRRNDLIPNLVQTVEGYKVHEKETQTLLAALRAQTIATPPGVAGPDFKGLELSLRAVIERYPDLKAGESFLRLQQSLVDTEQRIALARDYFNATATFYNSRLLIIPDRFAAALARLRPQALMFAADFERAPVQVKLADGG